MDIDSYNPQNGRLLREDGTVVNFVDLFDGGIPASEEIYDINSYIPKSGRIIGEDGRVYNIVDLIQNSARDDSAGTTIRIEGISIIPYDEPPYAENIGTEKDAVYILYIPEGKPGIDGIDGIDGTINGLNEIAFVDSETIAVEIEGNHVKLHALDTSTSGTTGMLFFVRHDGNAALTAEKPTSNQQVADRTWVNANWGTWTDLVSFIMADDISDIEVQINPGDRFFAKIWLSSDIERPSAQFRLTAIDLDDGTELVSATTVVDLLNINSIIKPAVFDNKYKISRMLPLSQIGITLSVMILAQGIQVGIVSNPPNEISYIAPISTGSGNVYAGILGNINTALDRIIGGDVDDNI